MRIRKIYIRGFGRLHDFSVVFDEKFHLLYGGNECGKSTTLEFILAMLYGFPSGRYKRIVENRRIRFTPWRARSDFGGVLTLTHNGVEYEIDRSFGDSKSKDRTVVIRTSTGEEVPLGRKEPGESLLSMTRGEFLNTSYIVQEDTAVTSDEEIEAKLMRTVSGSEGEISAGEMEAALVQYRRELDNPRSRKPTLRAAAVLEKEKWESLLEEANGLEETRTRLAEEEKAARDRYEALEKERLRLEERLAWDSLAKRLRKEQQQLDRRQKLEALQAAAQKSREKQGPLPGEEQLEEITEALRSWENRLLRLRSLEENVPEETAEQLAEQMLELQKKSEALSALEEEKNRLTRERQALLALQMAEQREWEQQQAEAEQRNRKRIEVQEEKTRLEERLAEEKERLEEIRRTFTTARFGVIGNPSLIAIATSLIPMGVVLAVALSRPWPYLISVSGVLLLLAQFLQRKPEADASELLIREKEKDVQALSVQYTELEQQLQTMPEISATQTFIRSEKLRIRHGEYEKEQRLWQDELQALQLEDGDAIGESKRDTAARLGSLEERERRLLDYQAKKQQAKREVKSAEDNFRSLSGAYFTAPDAERAREALEDIRRALQQQRESDREIQRLKEAIGEDFEHRTTEELETSISDLSRRLEGKDLPEAFEIEAMEKTLRQRKEEIEQVKEGRIAARLKLSEAKKNLLIPAVVEHEIRQAEETLAKIDEELEAVDLALDVLEAGVRELQDSFGPELNRVTAAHLAEMTMEEGLSVSVDRGFGVKITDPATRTRREQGYFSAGKVDQVYLALRMAIAEVVYRKEGEDALPLLLDDALDQYDNARTHRTLDKLMQSAKTHDHQVIFASCHARIADFVRRRGGRVTTME